MLGAIFTFLLSPFGMVTEQPASCRFAPVEGGREIAVTLHSEGPTLELVRVGGAVVAIDGARLEARVRSNTATKARDVLISTRDAGGHMIILALNESGQALLVRERPDGNAEKRIGHCAAGGATMRAWFHQ